MKSRRGPDRKDMKKQNFDQCIEKLDIKSLLKNFEGRKSYREMSKIDIQFYSRGPFFSRKRLRQT